MTTPRVQRHRQTDADRRKVNTRGKRVQRPRAKPAARKPQRARYQKTTVLGSFSGMCTALFAATGSIFWAVGAVGSGAGGAAAAWFEYRRDLIEVKRTGKPIGAKPKAGDPLPPGVKPTELDPSVPARKPQPRATKKPAAGQPAHPGCQASALRYCRCPAGPNRKGKTTTKRAASTTRKRTTK